MRCLHTSMRVTRVKCRLVSNRPLSVPKGIARPSIVTYNEDLYKSLCLSVCWDMDISTRCHLRPTISGTALNTLSLWHELLHTRPQAVSLGSKQWDFSSAAISSPKVFRDRASPCTLARAPPSYVAVSNATIEATDIVSPARSPSLMSSSGSLAPSETFAHILGRGSYALHSLSREPLANGRGA